MMQIHHTPSQALDTFKGELLVIAMDSKEDLAKQPWLQALDKTFSKHLLHAIKSQHFDSKASKKLLLPTLGFLKCPFLAIVELAPNHMPQNSATLGTVFYQLAKQVAASHIAILLSPGKNKKNQQSPGIQEEDLLHGLHLASYRYAAHLSKKTKNHTLSHVTFLNRSAPSKKNQNYQAMEIIAQAVAKTRDLVNSPPNELYPETFAKQSQLLAKQAGITCQVFNSDWLRKNHMRLLLAVGQGSIQTPRLVKLHYQPKKKAANQKPIVLIGKGITFDAGGLCLKSPDAMITMKLDMAGAAAVLACMWALGKLQWPVPVIGYLALAENMPSGSAYRTGDIIESASGLHVEINNTDAEGRLVLADTMHLALKDKPQVIIDIATLTGACAVALGPYTMGLFSNNDTLAEQLLTAANNSGEEAWRLPLSKSLLPQLHSEVADLKNTGERYGGAITAALFLEHFVNNTPWAHLDIAGPSFSNKKHGLWSAGGTGVAVRTLLQYIHQQIPKSLK